MAAPRTLPSAVLTQNEVILIRPRLPRCAEGAVANDAGAAENADSKDVYRLCPVLRAASRRRRQRAVEVTQAPARPQQWARRRPEQSNGGRGGGGRVQEEA